MSFISKILDAFKMESTREKLNMIEEKEKKPDVLFEWEGVPDVYNEPDFQEEEGKEAEEEPRPYQYILFADSIDMSYIIGSRQDFMRKDYTTDPLYNVSWNYIHKLWKRSTDLGKIIKIKKFFETLEEFENVLYRKENYIYGKLNIELEREYYESKKDELLISFLDKSFTDEYRNALELKTPKGRIARIDHWFMVMDYYKQYLTPNALAVLEALEKKWTGELMPNLLESKE